MEGRLILNENASPSLYGEGWQSDTHYNWHKVGEMLVELLRLLLHSRFQTQWCDEKREGFPDLLTLFLQEIGTRKYWKQNERANKLSEKIHINGLPLRP